MWMKIPQSIKNQTQKSLRSIIFSAHRCIASLETYNRTVLKHNDGLYTFLSKFLWNTHMADFLLLFNFLKVEIFISMKYHTTLAFFSFFFNMKVSFVAIKLNPHWLFMRWNQLVYLPTDFFHSRIFLFYYSHYLFFNFINIIVFSRV